MASQHCIYRSGHHPRGGTPASPLAVLRTATFWACLLCASMVPGTASAQTRLTLQYYTNTLAATPTNFFGSNVLAGSGVTITRGPQGQLTLTAVAGSVDTNAFQPASGTLTNLAGTGALTNAGAFQPGHVVLTNLSGTGALTNAGAFQPAHVILTNLSGTGALTNATAFQPANATLTNLAGTGALTNQGTLNAKQFGSLILTNLSGTGALTNAGAFQPGHVLLTNLSGTGALTNATAFQPANPTLTNLSGTGALTNRLAAAGGLLLHTNAAGLLTVSNAVAGGVSIDTNAFQPAHVVLTNLSGTGALTNATAFQPANVVLTNLVGTGALTNQGELNAKQYGSLVLSNLTGTGALTNQLTLDAKQFGSLILSNLSGTGAFTNLLAADGGLVLHIVGGTTTVSNAVAGGGGSGETNYNADAGLTNATTRYGLVSGKTDNTNFIRTLAEGTGILISLEGQTNLSLNVSLSYQNNGGGIAIGRTGSGSWVHFNTLAADGGLTLHSNENLLTFSNNYIAQPSSEVLTNLSGTGALTNAAAFQPAHAILTNLAGTGALTNQVELDGKQFGSQILTNLSGTGALTNGSAFQPGHVVLSNAVGTGILTNGTAFQPAHVILSNAVGTGVLTNGTAFQPAHVVLTNLAGTGALTNLLAAAAPLVFTTNGGVITLSNATAESFFSDSWTPISDDTNTVGWWRSYAGVTYDASSNVTEVADASGFGHPLKQNVATTYPFYRTNGLAGGRASVDLDGINDWMFTDPFYLEQPASTYLLYKHKTWTSTERIFGGLSAVGGTASNAFIYSISASPKIAPRSSAFEGAGMNRLPLGEWGSLNMIWSNSSSTISQNGLEPLASNPGAGGFGGIVLGAIQTGLGNGDLEFGELIVRAGVDTPLFQLKVKRYLQQARRAPFNFLLFDGSSHQSIYPPFVITNYWPGSRNWFHHRLDVSSETTSNMIVRAATTDRYYHPNNSTNILVAWEISNELANGVSTNSAYSNFVAYGTGRRAAGWKVVALTLMPRNPLPTATYETDRLNINLMMRANYLAFADALADVGTNGFLGCPLCATTNTYFSDGVHLTTAGDLIVAQYVTNAISRIDAGPVALTTTNTLYQTNGVNLGSGGTLNFVTGSNTLVQATNAAGVNHIQINSTASGGGEGDSFPAQTNLYVGFPLATDGADVFWDGPFYSARIWDDFMFGTNIQARIGEYGWHVVQAGNGTFDARPSGFGRSHVQIIRTDGGSSDITHMSQFTKSHWFGKGPVMFSTSVYVSHVPDTTQRFTMMYGFGDTHLGDATNGVYFKGDHTTDKWQFVTVTNSIAQTSVSLSNILVGWNSLNYLINADGTEAVAYVGTSSANAYPVATNTGNIPRFEDQACMPVMHIRKTQNTDRRTNAVDYFYFHEKFTTPR